MPLPIKYIVAMSIVALATTVTSARADGVNNPFGEATVSPIVRGPVTSTPAPLVIGQPGVSGAGQGGLYQPGSSYGFCSNADRPGTAPEVGGYRVGLACDHIAIGAALLGGMFLLGDTTAGAASN